MASETPAAALGLTDKGRIVPGSAADLVILGQQGTVLETIVAGETVHGGKGKADGPASSVADVS